MKNNCLSVTVVSFFKDPKGKVMIWQTPNVPLAGWLIFKLFSIIVDTGNIKSGFENLSTAFLFTWAYLEITSGKSYFRRALGGLIMITLLVGYFKIKQPLI